jgi:hypothetical protein
MVTSSARNDPGRTSIGSREKTFDSNVQAAPTLQGVTQRDRRLLQTDGSTRSVILAARTCDLNRAATRSFA